MMVPRGGQVETRLGGVGTSLGGMVSQRRMGGESCHGEWAGELAFVERGVLV